MFFATSPIVRRARAQWPLLATLAWALVVTAALAAVCAILVGPGMTRGLSEHLRAAGADTHVTATVLLDPQTAATGAQSVALAQSIAADAAAPARTESSVWASSPLFYLPGIDPRVTYMLDADTAHEYAYVSDGRWPQPAAAPGGDVEVAILESTAHQLALTVGDELVLAAYATAVPDGGPEARTATIVGIVGWEAAHAQVWSRDRLEGEGVGTALTLLPAYGPLLVAPGSLVDAAQPLERASIEVIPRLVDEPAAAGPLVDRLGTIKPSITEQLGEAAAAVSVQSQLGPTMADARAQQVQTAAMVVALLVAVVVVAAAALSHVGSALAARRTHEWTLAVERGASRWQAVRSTLAEVGVLAVSAAAIGALVAPQLYRGLAALHPTGWPAADGVGEPQVTWWVVVASVVGVAVPALTVSRAVWHGAGSATGLRGALRRDVATWRRAGLTVGVGVLATVGYAQLRSRAPGQTELDLLLVVAPVLSLLAAALVATWLIPLISSAVERLVKRSRGLVLPVAAWRGSRTDGLDSSGPRTALPTVLAAAAIVFSIAVGATWLQSHTHQTEVAVGADLTVSDSPDWGNGRTVEEATGASPVPVLSRPIQLGARPGSASVVAVNAQRAGELVRGRTPGDADWASLMAPLGSAGTAPVAASASVAEEPGIVFGADHEPALVIGGEVDSFAPVALEVTPTAVLADQWGETTAVTGEPILLDGTEHVSRLAGDLTAADVEGARLIGVAFTFDLRAVGEGPPAVDQSSLASITVAVPGAPMTTDVNNANWHVTSASNIVSAQGADGRSLEVPYADGTLDVTVGVNTFGSTGTRAIAMAAPPVDQVPVLVSQSLASEFGVAEGDVLDVRMGAAAVPTVIEGVVPYVPSRPGENVVVADRDVLTWALLGRGELGSTTDSWWVSGPQADSVLKLSAAGMPGAVAMADAVVESRSGAWSTPVLGALGVLSVAAAGLAWVAAGANASGLARGLARTNARLRGMGARRRDVRAIATVHSVLSATAHVLVGGVAGGLVAWTIAPWVVAGDGGQRPVPHVIFDWSPAVTAASLAVLVVGLVLVTLPAARAGASAAVPVALREGEAA